MKTIQRFGLLVAVLVAALMVPARWVGAQSQTSVGGTFSPFLSYVVEGVWTWKGASPIKFEGATNDSILTTLAIADPTAARTVTVPDVSGGVPLLQECGATGTGNQTCAPAAATTATKMYAGQSTLASNAAIITFPAAFTATTSYRCVADDITTRANPVQMLSTSTTTATITNTTGASDVINWICVGQ